VQQGIIEKVIVPNYYKKDASATARCFRLVDSRREDDGVILQTPEADDDEEKDLGSDVESGLWYFIVLGLQS
jgi:hypothetical protein